MKEKKEIPKTKLITPFVMLLATAIVAVYTFFQDYGFGEWLVIVFSTMVVFMILGMGLEKMVTNFVEGIEEKEEEERREAEEEAARLAEEEAIAAEAEKAMRGRSR